MHLIKNWLRAGLDLFFPRNCVVCQQLIVTSENHQVCQQCIKSITWIEAPYCSCCGKPFYGAVTLPSKCAACKEDNFEFDQGISLFTHEGVGKRLIHLLKYQRGLYLKKDWRFLFQTYLDFKLLENSVLVPVPLHSKKRLKRGFNQAEWIAQQLSKLLSNSPVERLLKKTTDTASQTFLSRHQRLQNVKNSFAYTKTFVLSPHKRYILVDDVFTTGATLNACAHVLRSQGAQWVGIFTLSHG